MSSFLVPLFPLWLLLQALDLYPLFFARDKAIADAALLEAQQKVASLAAIAANFQVAPLLQTSGPALKAPPALWCLPLLWFNPLHQVIKFQEMILLLWDQLKPLNLP